MIRFLFNFVFVSVLASCSNTPGFETGELKTLELLKQAFQQSDQSKQFIDARILLTREQIDNANKPVLFVELASGQNGTLTPYPGQGIGQTWLGADGATITMERGVLKASRGMGNDLMGSIVAMPEWSKIMHISETYNRKLSYITGNNNISEHIFKCKTQRFEKKELIEIWKVTFEVTKFEETCKNKDLKIKNTYYIDNRGIVRKSSQYHGDTIGQINTERLDR